MDDSEDMEMIDMADDEFTSVPRSGGSLLLLLLLPLPLPLFAKEGTFVVLRCRCCCLPLLLLLCCCCCCFECCCCCCFAAAAAARRIAGTDGRRSAHRFLVAIAAAQP